jgi:hypothetical protein
VRRVSIDRIGELIALDVNRFQVLVGRHWIEINQGVASTVGKVVLADHKVSRECRVKTTD